MAKHKLDESQLAEYLTRHVRYEWNMLAGTRDRLKRRQDPVTKNALIESFCVHARNLIEFYRGSGRKDYIKAKDFTDSSYKARFVPANTGEIGNKLYAKLNQQVAHLAQDRSADPSKKIGAADREIIFEALRKERDRFEPLIKPIFIDEVTIATSNPSATNMIGTASVQLPAKKEAPKDPA